MLQFPTNFSVRTIRLIATNVMSSNLLTKIIKSATYFPVIKFFLLQTVYKILLVSICHKNIIKKFIIPRWIFYFNNFGGFNKNNDLLRKRMIYLYFYNFFYLIVFAEQMLTIYVNSLQRKKLENTMICFTFYNFHNFYSFWCCLR